MTGLGARAIEGTNGYETDELDAQRFEEINLRRPGRPSQDYELGLQVLERVGFEEGQTARQHAALIKVPPEHVRGWLGIHLRLGLVRRGSWEDQFEDGLGYYLTRLGDRMLLWHPVEPPSRATFAEAIRRARLRLRRAG